MNEYPEMPSGSGVGFTNDEFDAWREEWFDFHDAVVDLVTTIFEESSSAEQVATSLRMLMRVFDDSGRPLKCEFEARAADTLGICSSHKRLGSETIKRDVDGIWSFKGWKVSRDEEGPIGVHREVARELMSALFSWGDLSNVGLARSARNERFIPPC